MSTATPAETCEGCRAIWRWHLDKYPLPRTAIRHFAAHQHIDLEAS